MAPAEKLASPQYQVCQLIRFQIKKSKAIELGEINELQVIASEDLTEIQK